MAARFTIKLDPKGVDFLTGVLPNVNEAMKLGIHSGMKEAGFLIFKTLTHGIEYQKKEGKFYIRKGVRKQASAPGQYAGIVTGRYLRSADFSVGADNSLEYGFSPILAFKDANKARWLELGTKNMKPRPALALATKARQADTFNILARSGKKFFEKLGTP